MAGKSKLTHEQKIEARRSLRRRTTGRDKIFYFVNGVILTIFTIFCLYPILCIISQAISDPVQVALGLVTFYPRGFSLMGFYYVLKDKWILHGFLMSLAYTLSGTAVNLVITYITAYALSRKELRGRTFFNLLFAFTMWFSGGLIPTYLLIKNLHLINTFWALIIPGALNVWNMIVCRTYLETSIPADLFDAASVDGAGYIRYMFSICIPLSKPIIAVLCLWYAIGHWNDYFSPLIYVTKKELKPFSLYLREYLVLQSNMDISDLMAGEEVRMDLQGMGELMKNSLILLSCIPLWILYPFIRKYLVQGIMVGSVKG